MRYALFIVLFAIPVLGMSQYGSKERMYSGYASINDGLESTRAILNKVGGNIYYDLTLKFQEEAHFVRYKFVKSNIAIVNNLNNKQRNSLLCIIIIDQLQMTKK